MKSRRSVHGRKQHHLPGLLAAVTIAMCAGVVLAERVTRFDGKTLDAEVASIDDQRVVLANNAGGPIPLGELWKIERAQPAMTGSGLVERVILQRGEIPAKECAVQEGVCRFQWVGGREAAIPQAAVRALLMDPGVVALARDAIGLALEKTNATDQVVAIGQDNTVLTIEGSVKAISDKAIELQYKGQDRTLSRSKVGAVVFGRTGTAERVSGALPWKAMAADGAWIEGTDARLAEGVLTLAVGAGKLELPWPAVLRLEHRGKTVRFLSQMDPAQVTGGPVVTLALPWQRDQNAMGRPLRLRGEIRETGLGTHAPSELAFDLPTGAVRFLAVVGLDEEFGRAGDCVVVVLVDDQEKLRQRIRGTDAAIPVDLDVRNGRRLTLRSEPGENLDIGDHVNWYDARLATDGRD